MNNNPIDIVIPWVNPKDENWKKDFEFWKEKETGNKDACRFRDWGFIKYTLRSIEKNCPWCRYVFLVLASPSQIPDWLNVDNPKLKIVYHKDYIPEEFLPTFNSNVIEMFFHKIPELSENFISCNDDMFFMVKKDETFYFRNDKPVYKTRYSGIINPRNNWEHILFNNVSFVNKFLSNNLKGFFHPGHVPVNYNKSIQEFVFSKNKDICKNAFGTKKFRTNTDISHWIFYDIQYRTKMCVVDEHERGYNYAIISGVQKISDYPMICINEGELSTEQQIKKYLEQLNNKFKSKCGFEK